MCVIQGQRIKTRRICFAGTREYYSQSVIWSWNDRDKASRGTKFAASGERVGGELRDGEELVLGAESLGAAVGDFTWRGVLD